MIATELIDDLNHIGLPCAGCAEAIAEAIDRRSLPPSQQIHGGRESQQDADREKHDGSDVRLQEIAQRVFHDSRPLRGSNVRESTRSALICVKWARHLTPTRCAPVLRQDAEHDAAIYAEDDSLEFRVFEAPPSFRKR
ncbi:MAG TPA: hypothetical protein VLV76_28135 [Candidatus Acidoferrum sp.]|nr:hypothetical protein [Candidatus Acidoferrum sp.]